MGKVLGAILIIGISLAMLAVIINGAAMDITDRDRKR